MIVRHTAHRNVVRGAFTLMEILVVVAIILILMGGASVAYIKYRDDALFNRAKMGVKSLETAVVAFNIAYTRYPNSLAELTQPGPDGSKASLPPEALITPWGNEYQYNQDGPNNQGNKPDIWAVGPDGRQAANWGS